MKYIQDPIHGHLKLEDWQISIIDTPEFQRLRRVSQIGFANLVYPGANHTRFEHSLGTMHIAKQLVEKMDADDDERREIVASALLHDVGHAPFSHCGERILSKYLRMVHEDIGRILRSGTLGEVLKELGFRVRRIVSYVKGESECNIVSGDIDADRMDYLVRDSYYTGVAYGVFDISRLINKVSFEGKRMIIEYGGLKAAESLLVSRYMMYPTVYFHHVCRIARRMFERAVEFCIEDGGLKPEDLLRMDDYDIVSFLRSYGGYPSELMDRIDSRRLFKRALYVGMDRVNYSDVQRMNVDRVEAEIAEMAGVGVEDVIVDIPPLEEAKEFKALVRVDDEIKRLDEVSSLVRALKEAEKDVWRLGVYTKKELVERVRRAASRFFNVDRTLRQKRLDELF